MTASNAADSATDPANQSGLAEFNELAFGDATELLSSCCPWPEWTAAVAGARPFLSLGELDGAAARGISAIPADRLPALLSRYPQISVDSGAPTTAARWSRREESGVHGSPDALRARLVTESTVYQRRFGFTFLISAAGLSGDQVLEQLTARLQHDRALELEVARGELSTICRRRVVRLIEELPAAALHASGTE